MTSLFTLHRLIETIILFGITMGPFYMILVPRGDADPRSVRTRRWNYVGAGIFMLALLLLCIVIDTQQDELRELERRLTQVEARAAVSGRATAAP